MDLIFDTETSGLPLWREDYTHPGQPWVVQLAAVLCDSDRICGSINLVILAGDRTIETGASEIHGYTRELCNQVGVAEALAARVFCEMASCADLLVCHNHSFDVPRVLGMIHRTAKSPTDWCRTILEMRGYCTMANTTNLLKLPSTNGKAGYKWPKLSELYRFLFEEDLTDAHDAMADVMATRRCYYELVRLGHVKGVV